ncbi:TPA: hypothetical protein ACIUF6_004460, partial [Salmonella enterica subsp. enterica serovar Saintpaul]
LFAHQPSPYEYMGHNDAFTGMAIYLANFKSDRLIFFSSIATISLNFFISSIIALHCIHHK